MRVSYPDARGVPMVDERLTQVGDGLYAWTQLPGSWGWSNAGLVTDHEACLLVDTLFDLRLTAQMLEAMCAAVPAATRIGTVVNTHGNGDHCYGNALVSDAEIIGTQGCVDDLGEAPPSRNQLLLRAGKIATALGPLGRGMGRVLAVAGFDKLLWLTEAAPLAMGLFEAFDFRDNEVVLPDRVFSGELELSVGDKRVQLLELGPAHTRGDAVVYVPDDRVLYTGDLVFHQAHPVIWEGPVSHWITALERLLALDVDVVVPGHGPLTDQSGLRQQLAYLQRLTGQARLAFDAGLPVEQAARELQLDGYADYIDAERLFVNVHTLYRDFRGEREAPDVLEMFAGMARLQAHHHR